MLNSNRNINRSNSKSCCNDCYKKLPSRIIRTREKRAWKKEI